MDLGISGKRALVTGSTAGIGFATARLLAQEGAAVWINGRTKERVEEAIAAIRADVPDAALHAAPADLGTADGCRAICETIAALDILVNNVGIFEPKAFAEIGDDDWFRFFEVNVMSGVRLTRHFIDGMRERDWGRIVFVSSESGVQIPDEMIHYGMTKSAQIAVARGVAETTRRTGITVNSILVGPTKSEGVATFVERLAAEQGVGTEALERDFFRNARPTSLLQRFIDVEEVAALIAYTCSAAASATNGSALRVDGGVVRAIT